MTGCVIAGNKYNFPTVYYTPAANPSLSIESYKYAEPLVETIARQRKGIVYTARVGESIIETVRLKTWPAITLKAAVPIKITDKNGTVFSFVISGDLVQKAESTKGKFYLAEQTISVNGATNYLKGGVFIENFTNIQTAFWFPPYDLPAVMIPMQPVAYSNDIHTEEEDAYFRVELLYMGKSKDTIKLAYREFIEDRIRPAFSQEVIYDYTSPTEVSYKNFQLDVIEATSSKIVYKVVSP